MHGSVIKARAYREQEASRRRANLERRRAYLEGCSAAVELGPEWVAQQRDNQRTKRNLQRNAHIRKWTQIIAFVEDCKADGFVYDEVILQWVKEIELEKIEDPLFDGDPVPKAELFRSVSSDSSPKTL